MVERAQYAVAIGASAGGLEPMQDLIESLPEDLMGSALIIAQHLSPSYKSLLSELIAKKTNTRVVTIQSEMPLEANTIYVTPPDRHIEVRDGHLRFVTNEEIHPKPSINLLFNSVAREYSEKAVGIILSGTGSDGAAGVTAIKRTGGIAIAQDLDTCKYVGMPEAAANTHCLEYMLSAASIGKNLPSILERKKIAGERPVSKPSRKHVDDETGVTQILELLEHKLGVDFSNYKKSTIHRRLQKRMQFKKIDKVEHYLNHIVTEPSELDELFKDILIGVTKFYRDKEVFKSLEPVLTKLVEDRESEKPIRIWVPGCASGEEVYSIAIMILEIARKKGVKELPLQIFATDIDQKALNHARIGFYRAEALSDIPKNLVKRYFSGHDDGYIVNSQVKKCILFSKHDVTANPPFLKIDLISCRNLLIYFDLTLQRQVIPVFHYALNNDGYLLLGKSESVANFRNLFTFIDSKTKIFLKKPVEKRFYSLPQLRPVRKNRMLTPSQNLKKQNLTIADMVKETVYNTFEHPYVVVDENLDMIEVHKEVSKYLKFKSGAVTTNILKVIVSDLQIELRALAGQALKNNQSARGRIRRFKPARDLPAEFIRITIKPLLFAQPVLPYYLVVFEQYDIDEEFTVNISGGGADTLEDPRLLQLEQELEATKEHMNTLVEELETSNEELQSTNEELQSSNEELQASNEELETSNEELQATNEELEIAYAEIRSASEKIETQRMELILSGNRLKALFNSTVQGHILLDSNYSIVMFNETASEFFNDLFKVSLTVGKSYVDYIPVAQFKEFHERFKAALAGKISKAEVEYPGDRHYAYNYIPIAKSKNLENDSILISFNDITPEKRSEKRLKEAYKLSEEQKTLWHRLFVDAPHHIAILKGPEYKCEYANPNFQKLLGNTRLTGRTIRELVPEIETRGYIELLDEVRTTGEPYHGVELPLSLSRAPQPEKEKRYFNFTFSPLRTNGSVNIVVYGTDVTDQVQARDVIDQSHKMLKIEHEKLLRLFDSAPLFIAILSGPDHVFEYANPFFREFFSGRELIGKKVQQAIPELTEEGFFDLIDQAYAMGRSFVGNEMKMYLDKGKNEKEEGYYNFVYHARKDYRGNTEGVTLIGYEVTDQVNARKTIQEKADYLFTLSEMMPQKVFTCTPDGQNDYNNSRMIEFCGLSNEELTKDGWQRIIHPNDLNKTFKFWQVALENQEEFQIRHRFRSHEGKYIWHLTRTVPVMDKQGQLMQWIGTSTDIHEQVAAEKKKDEFLNVASHELKTPLTTVLAYTEIIKDLPSIKSDPLALEYLGKSFKNQLRLNNLIGDLLDVTRIQSGKLKLTFKEVDYDTLLMQCLENISPIYTTHEIIYNGKVKKKIHVDESRIEQLLSNLVSNAVKYSPNANKVIISTEENGEEIITRITDFGIGIPKNKQQFIFNRFYRIEKNDSSSSGLGIGLYITSQLVRAHNGKIWLDSRYQKGSTFYFSLPLKNKRP